MSGKLLTISIAAYNVGPYIEEALDSIVIPEIMDELEVFIVDDGSTDDIQTRVKKYIAKWKNTFHYIRKENQGYGSTVNWSVEHATGKFIKLLDGDDYFHKQGLKELVDVLRETRADAVVSQARRCYTDGHSEEIFSFMSKLGNGLMASIHDVAENASVAAWGYTFRTDILRDNWTPLPIHHFYTDRLFVLQALVKTKTIQYHTSVVYNYRVGLNEQSTSIASVKRHYREAVSVDIQSFRLYSKYKETEFDAKEYIKHRLALDYAYTFCMFLDLDINTANLKELMEYDNAIRCLDEEIYNLAESLVKRVRLIRRSKYLFYYLWPVLKLIRNK